MPSRLRPDDEGKVPYSEVVIVMMDHAGRLGSIEATNKQTLEALEKHIAADDVVQKSIDAKLSEIVSLKHKGAGAFWLFSGVAAVALATFGSTIADWVVSWFKH